MDLATTPAPSSSQPCLLAHDLAARFSDVRAHTEALAAPLSPEDQVVQSMPDCSPTKWHRAHVTWFFETFVLGEFSANYTPFDPAFAFLFNSYYEAAGPRHTRAERGKITRPSVARVGEYRRHVDEAMADLLVTSDDPAMLELVELGLHHEQQHQELLLMDIKHLFSLNPTAPAYHDVVPASAKPTEVGWCGFDGGVVAVGADGSSFSYDNELPRHDTVIVPFMLADRLVTCGEWIEFIADGGYERPDHWLSDGWYTVKDRAWKAPEYWYEIDGEWHVYTLSGLRKVDPAEPVAHLSYYEADAFASWSGARLPTEFEWEAASSLGGHSGPEPSFHPAAAPAGNGTLRQMFDVLWQWTSSPYIPYPGFRTAPGAVGEYNGKFMVNTWTLRGGCVATPPGHIRASYRNFFHPATRWHFSGLRLAKDAD